MRALLALLVAAAPAATAEIAVSLPAGFHRVPDASLEETAALAPLAVEGDPPRRLVALYRQDEGSALFALSSVEAPLAIEPTSKAPLASAVAGHFKRDLGLEFELEKTSFVPGPAPRVEVWGTAAVPGGAAGRRTVGVAFYPSGRHHLVALASCPQTAADGQRAALAAAFAAVRPPPESDARLREPRSLSIAFWCVAAATVIGLQLMRRTARSRR